jgi:hypothetical protein
LRQPTGGRTIFSASKAGLRRSILAFLRYPTDIDLTQKWNKQDYFISLTFFGVTNLTMSIGEYKEEELNTAFNKITSIFSITLISDCLYFSPIYLSEGKKLSEWSLKFTSP